MVRRRRPRVLAFAIVAAQGWIEMGGLEAFYEGDMIGCDWMIARAVDEACWTKDDGQVSRRLWVHRRGHWISVRPW